MIFQILSFREIPSMFVCLFMCLFHMNPSFLSSFCLRNICTYDFAFLKTLLEQDIFTLSPHTVFDTFYSLCLYLSCLLQPSDIFYFRFISCIIFVHPNILFLLLHSSLFLSLYVFPFASSLSVITLYFIIQH